MKQFVYQFLLTPSLGILIRNSNHLINQNENQNNAGNKLRKFLIKISSFLG
jgi:hypothetical protein